MLEACRVLAHEPGLSVLDREPARLAEASVASYVRTGPSA